MLRKISAVAAVVGLLLAPGTGRADGSAPKALDPLTAGRYSAPLKGLLCTVCARAVAAEWMKIPAVEKASVDFDAGRVVVTVRLGKTVSVSTLRRALRRAERTANLGDHFALGDFAYIP